MQPSSLIFLVIVAIWVAYLIQHWVRRREHLATARSVDKFSEAMRVLERRTPLAGTLASTAGPGSYAREPHAREADAARPAAGASRATVTSPLRARAHRDEPLPPAHSVPPVELVRHRTFAHVLVRRIRGVLALAALVAVPVTVLLSAMHVLKWLSVGIAVGALAAVVVWLRVAAVREQAARRARRAQLRRLDASRTASVHVGRSAGQATAKTDSGTKRTENSDSEKTTDAAEPAVPGSWKPVPVPPPTYTLKETVHRPEPAREPIEERPVPIEVDDEIEAVSVPSRRSAVGS